MCVAGACNREPADSGAVVAVTSPAVAVEAQAVVALDCGFRVENCRPTPADSKAARQAGPFTLVAEVRLDGRPHEQAAAITRWSVRQQDRAYELGIDESQRPYLALSEDGELTRTISTAIRATQQLRLGATYELAAVVVPDEEVRLYLDGVEIHRQDQVVPAVHLGASPLGIRRRTREEQPSRDLLVGKVLIFDRALSAGEVVEIATAHGRRSALPRTPPMRALTTGPGFHWFGYYDKHQFDPTGRYVLGMSVGFENRRTHPTDAVEIGMIDLRSNDEWIRLGETRAWNWQQGCMLQWRPGATDEIVWNDRIGEGNGARFVTRILDVGSRTERLLPRPIYTIAADGKRALGIDFERIGRSRPTYGYVGATDRTEGILAPEDAGIYGIDMETGRSELIVSVAEVFATGRPAGAVPEQEHFVEMLQINAAGTRFLFYERWVVGKSNLEQRVLTADLDGSDLFMLSHRGHLSHVAWLDEKHIVIYSDNYDGYALFEDEVGYVSMILESNADGHQTFLRGGEWMLADTYPDRYRLQHPFLYHRPTDEVFAIADLLSPREYRGIYRADTHPRLSRDERSVVVDSSHAGGRQMYLIDVAEILDSAKQ